MKKCFKCGVEKSVTDFYVHPAMGDGRLGKCKECTKKDVRKNCEANLDYYRAYDKARSEDPKRKAQFNSLNSKRTERERKANIALSNAIRDGRIVRAEACWHCGSTRNVEGHHGHYDYPLIVTWLCRSCHCKAHRETTLLEQARAKDREAA